MTHVRIAQMLIAIGTTSLIASCSEAKVEPASVPQKQRPEYGVAAQLENHKPELFGEISAKSTDTGAQFLFKKEGKRYSVEFTEETPDARDFPNTFHFLDFNADGRPDLIIESVQLIGAGPQAGKEFYYYTCMELQGQEFVLSKYKPDIPCSAPSEYLSQIDYHNRFGVPRVGQELNSKLATKYLLNSNENLINAIMVTSTEKILSVAVDKRSEYLVYRYGKPGATELEVRQTSTGPDRFRYYNEVNDGFARFNYQRLFFINENYQYKVYDNYDEHQIEDGAGIVVTNIITKDETRLRGEVLEGSLSYLENIDWLTQEYKAGDDYADE